MLLMLNYLKIICGVFSVSYKETFIHTKGGSLLWWLPYCSAIISTPTANRQGSASSFSFSLQILVNMTWLIWTPYLTGTSKESAGRCHN